MVYYFVILPLLIKLFAKLTSFQMQEKNFPEALRLMNNILPAIPCTLLLFDPAESAIRLLSNTEIDLSEVFVSDDHQNAENIFDVIPATDIEYFKTQWNKCLTIKGNEKYSFVSCIQQNNVAIQVKIYARTFKRFPENSKEYILISFFEIEHSGHDNFTSGLSTVKNRTFFENDQFELLYKATHDLQAPLRKLSTFVDLLFSKLPTEHNSIIDTYKAKISLCKEEMMMMLEDLNILFNSKQKLNHRSVCDLNHVIDSALSGLNNRQYSNHVFAKYQDLPSIEGNREYLTILFQNIFLNALLVERENEKPEINIEAIELKPEEFGHFSLPQKNKYYKVIITDKGTFFSKGCEEKIFEPFFRVPTRNDRKNNGLALAICKSITENHQGKIYAVNDDDYGTQITLILPVKQISVC